MSFSQDLIITIGVVPVSSFTDKKSFDEFELIFLYNLNYYQESLAFSKITSCTIYRIVLSFGKVILGSSTFSSPNSSFNPLLFTFFFLIFFSTFSSSDLFSSSDSSSYFLAFTFLFLIFFSTFLTSVIFSSSDSSFNSLATFNFFFFIFFPTLATLV